MASYPCPCCGHRTLDAESPGTYQLCPVCCWEDVPLEEAGYVRSHDVTLAEAQASFEACGACTPDWTDTARAPGPDEPRDPSWLPLSDVDGQRQRILGLIDAGFSGLRRGRGMRIYEAELADNYGLTNPTLEKRRSDDYQRYDEVPAKAIAQYYSVLSFFDVPGFVFHIGAYMAWAMQQYPVDPHSSSIEFTIYSLMPGDDDSLAAWHDERFAAFDAAQIQAIVAFLELMVIWEPMRDPSAVQALRHWRSRSKTISAT